MRDFGLSRRRRAKASPGAGIPAPANAPSVDVRVIPIGVSGQDLAREALAALRIGAIWRRGDQRVRIRGVTSRFIIVTELSHGSALQRRIPRAHFLRTSRPEN